MAEKVIKEIVINVSDKGTLKVSTREVEKLNNAINETNTASKGAAKGAQTLDRNLKGNAAMSSNASKNFSKQSQGMQSVLVPAYAEVAARVFALTAAFTALERAANYRVLVEGQTQYAKLTGKNMGSIAKKIQEATGYMIGFKQASTAAALGTTSGLTSNTMVRMAEVARAASVALGRDLTDSMDRLTRGIVKAEPEILDEIGIIIRLDTVYKKYAESLGTTTAKLTEYEKLQARVNAILEQGETKFGDIATSIDPNAWSQLSASVLDMVNSFSAFVSGPIEGVVRFLSESKVLLAALLALVAKSLLGKLSGVFSGFNKQLSAVPKKLEGLTKRIDKWKSSLGKTRAGYADKLVPYQDAEKALKATLQGEGVNLKKTGALYAAAAAKGLTGPAFIKAVNKSLGIVLGGAKNAMVDGVVTRGALKGDDGSLIQLLEQQQRTLQKGIVESNKGMKGLMGIQFLNWMTNAITSTAELGKRVTLSGLSFLNYAKQVGKATQNVGLFSKSVIDQTGTMVRQQGALSLIWDTFKQDFDKVWGPGVWADRLDRVKTWSRDIINKFAGTSQRLYSITGTIGESMFRMLNGISRQSSLFASKMPAPLLKAWHTIKKASIGITKTLGITAKALLGLPITAITALVNGLQLLSFAIGAISLFSYVGRMFFDWGKFMGKARDAASSLAEELDEVNTRLTEAVNINMEGIAGSMTGAIQSAEFISAVTTDLSEALAKALRDIDMKAVMQDGWGNFADFFYDFFGQGLEDSLGRSLGNALNSQAHLGNKISEKMLGAIKEELTKAYGAIDGTRLVKGGIQGDLAGYFSKLQQGIALTSVELRKFNDTLEYAGADLLVGSLELLNRKLEEQAKLSAKAAGHLKSLAGSFDSTDKAIKTLLKGTIADTPFSQAAEEYEKLKVLLGKDDISISNKILAIFENKKFDQAGISSSMEAIYAGWITTLKDQKKKLSKLKLAEGSTEDIKALEDQVKSTESQIFILGKTIRDKLLGTNNISSLEGLMPKLFGGDLSKMNEDAVKLATSIKKLEKHAAKLGKADSGVFAMDIASDKSSIVTKHLKTLTNKRDLNKKTPTLSVAELAELEAQIRGLTEESWDLLRISDKVAEQMHKQAGTIYSLSYRLNNLKKDLQLTSVEWIKLKDAKIDLAWVKVRKALSPLEKEAQNLASVFDIINNKLGANTVEANNAIKAYTKLNSTLGKLQTTMQAKEFTETQTGEKSFDNYAIAVSGDTESVSAKMVSLAGQLERERAAKVKSLKASNHTEEFATKASKLMEESHAKILKGAEKRFKLERKTAKLLNINARRKAISEERVNLKLQADNWKETSTLLELRQTVAKLERDYAKEGLDFKKQELLQDEIMLAYSKLEFELFQAKREEAVQAFETLASVYTDIATTISSGIGQAASDYFMGKDEETDLKGALAQSFADAAGGVITSVVDEQLTGRKGLVASLFDDGPLKDAIFGAEDPSVQLGRDMNSLAKLADGAGLKVRIVSGTDAGNLGDNTAAPSIVPEKLTEAAVEKGNTFLEWIKGFFVKNQSPHSIATYDQQAEKGRERIAQALENGSGYEGGGTMLASTGDQWKNERIWRKMRENIREGNKLGNSTSQKAMNEATRQTINENADFRKAVKEFKSGESKFNVKQSHASTNPGLRYNRQLTGFQHPESVQDAKNYEMYQDFKNNKPITGSQPKLSFTGPGIPTNSAVSSTGLLDSIKAFTRALIHVLPNDNIMSQELETSLLREQSEALEAIKGNTTKTELEKKADEAQADAKLKGEGKGLGVVVKNAGALKQGSAGSSLFGDEGTDAGWAEQSESAILGATNKGSEQNKMLQEQSMFNDSTNTKLSTDTMVTVGNATNNTLQAGFKDLIYNGKLDTAKLALSFVQQVGNSIISGAASGAASAFMKSFVTSANGNVLKGGFQAFAKGGVVTKPTIGLIGEGKDNEAVVPLPDGRAIPVMMSGGGASTTSTENNINVTVNIDGDGNATSSTESDQQSPDFNKFGEMISQTIQQELLMQQRPGGILSPY